MTIDTISMDSLSLKGDTGIKACAIRLRAARYATGLPTAKQFAEAAKQSKQTITNIESGRQYPNRDIISYLYRYHRIDFNFVYTGEYKQLPLDVVERLYDALEVANNEWDQKEG